MRDGECISLRKDESTHLNVRNYSGHVIFNYSHATLRIPVDSQRPGVEVHDAQGQASLPQLRREGDQEDRPRARHPGLDAAGHLLLDERTRAGSPTRGPQLDY